MFLYTADHHFTAYTATKDRNDLIMFSSTVSVYLFLLAGRKKLVRDDCFWGDLLDELCGALNFAESLPLGHLLDRAISAFLVFSDWPA